MIEPAGRDMAMTFSARHFLGVTMRLVYTFTMHFAPDSFRLAIDVFFFDGPSAGVALALSPAVAATLSAFSHSRFSY